ncbi:hypothetical protein KIW84_022129 [Lathyrus oleraceus]|uniref:Sm protein G n=1 Tax=Pisum sativum TaxID=3888 RepID=A0A9D4Y9Z0_PEA|nr:hypothetical protein KIW84_022129 [Pisum sativum]
MGSIVLCVVCEQVLLWWPVQFQVQVGFVAGWLNDATNVIQTCFGSVFLMVAQVHGKVILHLGYVAHYAVQVSCVSIEIVGVCMSHMLSLLLAADMVRPAARFEEIHGQTASNQAECKSYDCWYSCGFDQFMNLVVDNTVEVNGNEKNDIGMVVIRGNSVVTVEALEPVNRSI